MLSLPQVTLLSIDTVSPEKTLRALEFSTRWVRFAEVVLLTDTTKHSIPATIGYKVPVRVVHHTETDRMTPRLEAPWHPPLPYDYETAVMCEPSQHVKTPHFILQEWDSAVLNPEAWNPEWLRYDFIGAPWPPHHEPGYPECDGVTNAVGNGGFSLRSIKFARATRRAVELFREDWEKHPSSDMWPARTCRKWLESQGVRFAPPEVAARFSCENRVYCGQWGMHGRWTCEMNNWGGPFFGSIRPKQP